MLQLYPSIVFGHQHSYSTWCSVIILQIFVIFKLHSPELENTFVAMVVGFQFIQQHLFLEHLLVLSHNNYTNSPRISNCEC